MSRSRADLMLGGASPRTRPLFFVSPKKRGEKNGDPGVAPFGRPALLESQGRPGMARRLYRRLAGPETSLTFCDARRVTRGERRLGATGCVFELLTKPFWRCCAALPYCLYCLRPDFLPPCCRVQLNAYDCSAQFRPASTCRAAVSYSGRQASLGPSSRQISVQPRITACAPSAASCWMMRW